MNDIPNDTVAAFMEVAVKRIEAQGQRIAEMEEQISAGSNYETAVQTLIMHVEKINTAYAGSQVLAEKLNELSPCLSQVIDLLQRPIENKVLHHHHVPRLIWITAGLLLALSLVCSGWYQTSEKLEGYRANDTKFRLLKLDTANKGLQNYLWLADSLYHQYPDLRETILQEEEQNQRNRELLQRAKAMESAAKELKRKAKQK